MLRIAATIVIAFFAILWSTGNDLNSVKNFIVHWAEGRDGGVTSRNGFSDDWGVS